MKKLPKTLFIKPYDVDSDTFFAGRKAERIAVTGKTIEAGEYTLKRKVKITSKVIVE